MASYKSGTTLFQEQLGRIPKNLTPEMTRQAFRDLHAHLEQEQEVLKRLPLLRKAEKLSDQFPICAYGYPKTYMSFLNGDITLDKLLQLID